MTATNKMRPKTTEKQSDEALLNLILAEFESSAAQGAVSELFKRYQGRVYQWCYRYTGSHENALDLSQEVFLGAYKSLKTFGGRSSFSSWLYAIARNRCVSAMRKSSPLDGASADTHLLKDYRAGPDGRIEDRQETEALLGLMRDCLSSLEQEALCLQIFERLPVDSITEVLDIHGSTGARGVLQNARRKLRATLAGRAETEGEQNHD